MLLFTGLLDIGADRVPLRSYNQLPTIPSDWEIFVNDVQRIASEPRFWMLVAVVVVALMLVLPRSRRALRASWQNLRTAFGFGGSHAAGSDTRTSFEKEVARAEVGRNLFVLAGLIAGHAFLTALSSENRSDVHFARWQTLVAVAIAAAGIMLGGRSVEEFRRRMREDYSRSHSEKMKQIRNELKSISEENMDNVASKYLWIQRGIYLPVWKLADNILLIRENETTFKTLSADQLTELAEREPAILSSWASGSRRD